MFIEESRPAKIPNIEIETDLLISDLFSRMNKLIDDTLALIKKEANDDELKIKEIKNSYFILMDCLKQIRKESLGIDSDDYVKVDSLGTDLNMTHICLSTTMMQYTVFGWSIEEGNILEALDAVSFAFESYGMAKAYIDSNNSNELKKQNFFKFMAGIRHSENRDMKAQAIQYYKDHKHDFKGKDEAAFYISTKIVNMAYSTVRGYLKNI